MAENVDTGAQLGYTDPGGPEGIANMAESTATSTASAAGSMVFMMETLKDFNSMLRNVLSNPAYSATAYTKLASMYQHSLNPAMERNLRLAQERYKLDTKQIASIRQHSEEVAKKARNYAILGGAITGVSLRLAKLQEGFERAAATRIGTTIGGGGMVGGVPGSSSRSIAETAKQLAISDVIFEAQAQREYGADRARLVNPIQQSLANRYRQAGVYDIGSQREISKALALTQAGSNINAKTFIDQYMDRYARSGGTLQGATAIMNNLISELQNPETKLGAFGDSAGDVLGVLTNLARRLEESSGNQIKKSTGTFDIINKLANAAGAGGLGAADLETLIGISGNVLDVTSAASRNYNALKGGNLVTNQNRFRELYQNNPVEALQDYNKFIQSQFKKFSSVNAQGERQYDIVALKQATGLTQVDLETARDLNNIISKLDINAVKSAKSLNNMGNALYKVGDNGKVVTNLNKGIQESAEKATDVVDIIDGYMTEASARLGKALPKELSYAGGVAGGLLSGAMAYKFLRGGSSAYYIASQLLNTGVREQESSGMLLTKQGGVQGTQAIIDAAVNAAIIKQVIGGRGGGKVSSMLGSAGAIVKEGGLLGPERAVGSYLTGFRGGKFSKLGAGIGTGLLAMDLVNAGSDIFTGQNMDTKGIISKSVNMISDVAMMMGPLGIAIGAAGKLGMASTDTISNLFIDKHASKIEANDAATAVLSAIGMNSSGNSSKFTVDYDKVATPAELAEMYQETIAEFNAPGAFSKFAANYKRSDFGNISQDEFNDILKSSWIQQANLAIDEDKAMYEKEHAKGSGVGSGDGFFGEATGSVVVQFVDSSGKEVGSASVQRGGRQIIQILSSDVRAVG